MSTRPLRIAVIASARYPIREPFAGGLESHTWTLTDGLLRRGHEVALFAAPGSDPQLQVRHLDVHRLPLSAAARSDVSMPPRPFLEEHHAYLTVMMQLMDRACGSYDVVHNNSLHHLPVAMARAMPMPMVTTLHTPPTPWLESAIASGPCPITFVAVSSSTATAWRHLVPVSQVVLNGVDLQAWQVGPGAGPLVWFGRLVREKGPDLAIRAARDAGMPLLLAGPISDERYFDDEIRPMLGDGVDYLGHLPRAELTAVVGRARASLVTPRWDEPYGLVAAESLACGTPVIGFARGGVPEVVDDNCAILVGPDDVSALADAVLRWRSLSRGDARRRAESHCAGARMIDEYEQLYRDLAGVAA